MSDIEEVERLLNRLDEERQRAGRIRIVVICVLLGSIGFVFGNLWWRTTHFDGEALVGALENQATRVVWPRLSTELVAVKDDAVPAISEALSAEAEALLPRLSEALASEAETFQKELAEQMKTSLDAAMVEAISQREGKMKERLKSFAEDPELYDELMRRLQVSIRQWAEQELDTTFERHVLLLNSINETVQSLFKEATQGQAVPEQSAEDVLLLFLQIMNTRLGGEG